MCSARVITPCSFSSLPGDFFKLRDRSRIAASASSIRCSNLLRSSSRSAARQSFSQSWHFELFSVFAPRFLGCWVIGANMGRKLFVALQLEVAHHLIERCARGRTGRFEPPATFGTTKTPKILLLNPYQLPAHGRLCRCALT